MKVCAACNENLPKDSYSKKQWKLDKYQRRCKVCVTNNREVQLQQPIQQDNDGSKTNEIVKALDSICLKDLEKKINDEELFKQPPAEDCPICFLCLPTLEKGWRYMPCCGKVICSGCVHAPVYDHQGNEVDNEKCPFCRTPDSKSKEEIIKRMMKRVEANDAIAIYNLGCYYQYAAHGFPQDYKKALELFHKAGEFGYADAYLGIGNAYDYGQGVKVDKKKANHYYKLAAIKGDADARHNLGINEKEAGNTERALKHHMIAVGGGDNDSLGTIKQMYSKGYATKEDYTKALQSYQAYFGEIKSPQRDKAAAANEDYRYY